MGYDLNKRIYPDVCRNSGNTPRLPRTLEQTGTLDWGSEDIHLFDDPLGELSARKAIALHTSERRR